MDPIKGLTNRTNAAVLLTQVAGRFFACTFGHGRHLLKPGVVVRDFGVKAALNSLKPDSLRSVDTLVLEDQALHRRAQASHSSGIEAFGLDVSRDILRAVTGLPRPGVGFVSISGAEETAAVSARIDLLGDGRARMPREELSHVKVAVGFDPDVAQFLFPREDWRETTFRLDGREHLRRVKVSGTDVSAYSGLLAAGGGA